MQSTVRLRNWGYRIRRRIRPCGEPDGKLIAGSLCVDVRLVNLGLDALTTPYVVGHLFNVQGAPSVGPGYSVSFALRGAQQYKDVPDSRPLEAVAVLQLRDDGKTSEVKFAREVPEYERAMASFRVRDQAWKGGFAIASNGKLYAAPAAHGQVLEVDPDTDTHSFVGGPWASATTPRVKRMHTLGEA